MSGTSLRIIVAGLAGLYPVGGVQWDYFQYLIGLSRLGHDVYYFEDTWQWPYQPVERRFTNDPAYSLGAIGAFFAAYEPSMVDRWRYVHLHDQAFGVSDADWREIARTADLFINVSGASMIPDELGSRCRRVFVDTDPGYNQILLLEPPAWAENPERWRRAVHDHDVFFTYAENIGAPDCLVPLAGLDWHPTRMPIVRQLWDGQPPPAAEMPWTTITTWNAFAGELTYEGRTYRSKDAGFARLIDLPARSEGSFLIALGGRDAPAEELEKNGWTVVDGPSATKTADLYRNFIGSSVGEVSAAKDVYSSMRTGWFSTRSACYLASGRPAVVEDTAWSRYVPAEGGLFAFTTASEAAEGLAAVRADLLFHSRAAREASEYFDHRRVLSAMLETCFAASSARSATITNGGPPDG